MALTEQERQIVEYGVQNGKSKEEVLQALAKYRQTATPLSPPSSASAERPGIFSSQGAIGRAARSITDFLGGGAVADTYGAEIAKLSATDDEKKYINQPTTKATLGSGLMLGSSLVGSGGTAVSVAKATAGQVAKNLGIGAAIGAGGAYLYDIGQNLSDNKERAEIFQPSANVLVGGTLGPLGVGGRKGGEAAVKGAAKAAKAAGAVSRSPVVRGALQLGEELGERVPRFVSRKNVQLRDAATRAERIANSPAPIANALKAGVDERIINTIEQADEPTRKGYGQIVRLAEESVDTSGTLKTTARPEIIAGDAAAKQYKLIDDQRKKIGKAIGDATKALSKDTQVPMADSYGTLDDVLRELGIDIDETGKGLSFGKTGFTKAQRAKINELYELATEGGESLTPFQIHDKDRLFSQLQREARMEGIGDIMVETAQGPMSLFSIFRDVYSEALERVAPEIKPLNKQYRNLRTFVDDIEGSIIKGGKFETNSAVDPAEFAQTNLRRLFSEAQSAADYRAIAEEMDAAARVLGYEGAAPSDLARFAYEIRKIYPESTPRTGFEGGIRASIGGVVDAVMKAGKADLTDQQKAIRDLISALENGNLKK